MHGAQVLTFFAIIIAIWLILLALGSILVGLILGAFCRRFVRGRHLLWLLPIPEVLLFLALDRRFGLVLFSFEPALSDFMHALAIEAVVVGSLVAACIVAAFGRAIASSARLASDAICPEPAPWVLPCRPAATVRPSSDLFGSLREGLVAPADGFLFMAAHRGLWRCAVIPVLLNLIITAVILLLLVAAGVTFAVKLHPHFPQVWWGLALEILTAVVLLLVAGALAVGAGMVLNNVLCGHFHAKLARHAELLLGMSEEQMREVPFRDQAADAVRDIGHLLVVNAGLLALNIVPGLGTVAAILLGCYLNGLAFGSDYLEFPMSLRGLRRDEQRTFVRRHRWHTIGLGMAVFVLNLVPVVGSILLATASVGAVLLYRRLEPTATDPALCTSTALKAVSS